MYMCMYVLGMWVPKEGVYDAWELELQLVVSHPLQGVRNQTQVLCGDNTYS